MTLPSLSIVATPSDSTAEATVVGVLQGDTAPEARGADAERLRLLGVTGAADQFVRALDESGALVAYVGLGTEPTTKRLRSAAAVAIRSLTDVSSVVLDFPIAAAEDAVAVLEGAALGAYAFTDYKTGEPTQRASEIQVAVGDANVTDDVVRRAVVAAEAVYLARDLVNTPSLDLNPEQFAERAVSEVGDLPIQVQVMDEAELTEGGFGGILGVGRGSANPPRLVFMDYHPEGAEKHLALVGKGITFDTGGVSLKPAASMVGMKFDMSGAAACLATVLAAAKLALPVRVTAALCLAENMPSGTAIKPDDVLTMRGGKTVEVTNTDAEGRLVMADGLQYSVEHDPDVIVDVATLTGAQVVALGDRTTGLMGNDEDTVTAFARAAQEADEEAWIMPLPEELGKVLESDVADLVNAKPGNRSAGMLLAGRFLQEFVSDADGNEVPWVHVDIAGPANNEGGAYGWQPKGATGVMVRTLIAYARDLGRIRP